MTTPPNNIEMESSNPMVISYQEVLAALLERAWIIALFLLIGVFAGFSYIQKSPRMYESRTVLYIEPPKNIVNIQQVTQEDARSSEATQNMLQLLQSKPLLLRVAEAADLGKDPAFLSVPEDQANRSNQDAAEFLAGSIVPIQRKGTTFIDLFIKHRDPRVAQRLGNVVAREFMTMNIQQRLQTTDIAYKFLSDQLDEIRHKLEESELMLQSFKEKNGVPALDSAELKDVNLEMGRIRQKRLMLESDLEQIKKMGDDPARLLGLESIQVDPTVDALQKSIAKQNEMISIATQRITEQHPRMVRMRDDLTVLQKNLYSAAKDAVKGVEPRLKALQSQEDNIQKLALDQSRNAIEYNRRLRDVEANKAFFESLSKRMSETSITKSMDFDNIRIIEPADFRGEPISPNKRKIMLAAVSASILIGISLSMVLHSFDSSIKTVDQAENILKLPCLTAVPEARARRSKSQRPPSPKGSKPTAANASKPTNDDITPAVRESFRTLLVSLSLLGKKEEGRVCLFTSAVPAEGKTFCSFYCAAHLAGQGSRTLLVDADLRKPYLHQMITKGMMGPGVSEVLSEQKTSSEVIQTTQIDNLFFVSAGSRSPNPPKLLVNDSFQKLIETYSAQFDYVILDSAPVNAVADTLLMVKHVQRICLITRSGSTPRRATLRAIEFLRQAGRDPSGVVLNRFRDRRGLYYYYHYSYHKSYGREHAYGTDRKKS
ncbi:MAG: polysaccharide biosynthesis tyrosine autokinase [Verrucomicrobiota bacterium]